MTKHDMIGASATRTHNVDLTDIYQAKEIAYAQTPVVYASSDSLAKLYCTALARSVVAWL
jgi:hypothetical protein